MIVIVGLGPGDPMLLTREAWDVLSSAPQVYLRTRKHPTVAGLPKGLKLRSFDSLYASADSFDEVYSAIADKIVAAAKPGRKGAKAVVYAVPGHPLVGERSVRLILERATAAGIATRIVSGLSFIEPVLEALSSEFGNPIADPLSGLQLCDALDLAVLHHPPLDPDRPALVAQVYARHVASDVKLTLLNQYPPGHKVVVVRGVRDSGNLPVAATIPVAATMPLAAAVPLAELDHADIFDHLTSLYIPALPQLSGFEALQETIAYLRAPEGCPWDREQTHQSLRVTLLEEAYEVLTAIDEDDMPALKEELGDLLLNVILQAQIATEADEFRMSDVVAEIDAKLKRRHPHIFGNETVRDSAEVVTNWHAIKKAEKAAKGLTKTSVLDGIAPALPALAQAQKIAHRADRAGFRWKKRDKRLEKVLEEIEEVRSARGAAHRQEEFGDLMFSIAYWADGFGIDIETATREANLKFMRRFKALESLIAERGQDMTRMSEAQLLAAWKEVKSAESRVPSPETAARDSGLGTRSPRRGRGAA